MPAQTQFGGLSQLMIDIDDWCGTRPPRRFPPRPRGFRDMMITVVIHNIAEQLSDAALRRQLQGLAATGFKNASRSLGK